MRRARRELALRWTAVRPSVEDGGHAAERERPGKQRSEYERNAARSRSVADGDAPAEEDAEGTGDAPPPRDPTLLN